MIIGLLGLGTIGSGVYEIAQKSEGITLKTILDQRCWMENMTCDINDILNDPEIELVVETMGGLHPAYEFARAVLESGKHFVTANKYLVSVYGRELLAIAREKGKAFLYDAACGGGIAYLANLQIAKNIDKLTALGGILNGTTNFILDAMQTRDMDYAEALKEAQALGYAERDPSSDVDGLDTQRKLMLACSVGLDAYIASEDIPTYGISSVLPADVAYCRKNDLVLRLCACAECKGEAISAYVEPTMVSASDPESAIHTNVNYAWYTGECYGLMSYIGQGAGKLPTAANVIRDVRTIIAGGRYMTSEACRDVKPDNSSAMHAYYVRIPAGEAFPENWIARKESDAEYDYIETLPVSVAEMHGEMAERKSAFFAGIRKG